MRIGVNTVPIQPAAADGYASAMGDDNAGRVQGPASYFPSIEKQYGRPIGEWQDLIRESDLTKHMELVNWLKADYGMGHGHANALVAYTLAEDAGT